MLLLLSFSSNEERDAFDYIYTNYKNLMMHKAYGILRDTMLAEDAVSEAMIRIYRNIAKIDDPASPRSIAFVITIVKNAALTILKRENGQNVLPIREEEEDGVDIEDEVLSKISFEHIFRLLDTLGEELRSVFLLKFTYDLSHKRIGEMLGISENNVTVRLHRARKKLARLLQGEGVNQ